MTIVVAVIDQERGSIHIGADSKVTWDDDEKRSRQVYTEPALKIVLLSDDLAVGYSGEGPEELASKVASLRGRPVGEVLSELAATLGGSFVVATRDPVRLWMVDLEGGIQDRTLIGRAWAGDSEAFNAFQKRYDDFVHDPALFRLQSAMQHIVHLAGPASVGGYTIIASAGPDNGFRYLPLRSELWPESVGKTTTTNFSRNDDGTVNFTLRASFTEGPMVLAVLPGRDPTQAALGLYVENAGVGYLYCDGTPAECKAVHSATPQDFVQAARDAHGQVIALAMES
jgi:hypothetical protein